jgi:hypothetical protein
MLNSRNGYRKKTVVTDTARLDSSSLSIVPKPHTKFRTVPAEVECIGKGKAHLPYEFRVKVSIATTLHRSAGGQFIAHAKALPGNSYDGHTLATVISETETQIGASLTRIATDRGYRGHNAPPRHKFRVYISGQRRRVTETIKRELHGRSAVEPVLGHAKAEHRMGRNYLAGTHGDAANAVLAAAGYNFRRLLEWLALFLSAVLAALKTATTLQGPFRAFFTGDKNGAPRQTRMGSALGLPSNLASSRPSLISMLTPRILSDGSVIEFVQVSDQAKSSMEHSSAFGSWRV